MCWVRRAAFVLVFALFSASCGSTPSFVGSRETVTTRSGDETKIGDAAVLDRSDSPTTTSAVATTADPRGAYPSGVTFADADGVELYLDARATRDWHQGLAVELALSVRNSTTAAIGYLTDKESHFALRDPAGQTLWTDATCRSGAHGQLQTGFLRLEPGQAVTISDYYPVRPGNQTEGCEARPGPATLVASLTVCRELPADDICPAGKAERVEAKPLAVTIP